MIFRINALFENSIVFDGIIIISSAISFGYILVKGKNLFRIICFVISFVANVLTFSRVSIVGSIMLYSVEYILLGKKRQVVKYIRILSIASFVILMFLTFGSETALYQRLFNKNMTNSSDIVHVTTTKKAREMVMQHPLLGIGMGTQGYDSKDSTVGVIRDGCWLQFALELGLPLTFVYVLLIFVLMLESYKKIKVTTIKSVKIACGVYISIMLYFIAANFVNSAYNAKEVFGLCWLLTGLMLWRPNKDYQSISKGESV